MKLFSRCEELKQEFHFFLMIYKTIQNFFRVFCEALPYSYRGERVRAAGFIVCVACARRGGGSFLPFDSARSLSFPPRLPFSFFNPPLKKTRAALSNLCVIISNNVKKEKMNPS